MARQSRIARSAARRTDDGGSGAVACDDPTMDVILTAGTPGVSVKFSRCDHVHQLDTTGLITGPMVHLDEGGNLRVDNAWTKALISVPLAGDIDVEINNGFQIAELTANLTVVIPTATGTVAPREGRKITFEITQDTVTRTVTWTGGAGGYQFAKAGSAIGPTQAQFDTLLAAMLNAESLKISFEYDGLRDRWLCTGLTGPYV